MIILWKCLFDSVTLCHCILLGSLKVHTLRSFCVFSPLFFPCCGVVCLFVWVFCDWLVLFAFGWLVDFKALYILGTFWFIHLGFVGIFGEFVVLGFVDFWLVGLFFGLYFVFSRVVSMFLCFQDSFFSLLCFLKGLFILTVSLWVCYEGKCFFSCLCFLSLRSGRVHRLVFCNTVLAHDEFALHLFTT